MKNPLLEYHAPLLAETHVIDNESSLISISLNFGMKIAVIQQKLIIP